MTKAQDPWPSTRHLGHIRELNHELVFQSYEPLIELVLKISRLYFQKMLSSLNTYDFDTILQLVKNCLNFTERDLVNRVLMLLSAADVHPEPLVDRGHGAIHHVPTTPVVVLFNQRGSSPSGNGEAGVGGPV